MYSTRWCFALRNIKELYQIQELGSIRKTNLNLNDDDRNVWSSKKTQIWLFCCCWRVMAEEHQESLDSVKEKVGILAEWLQEASHAVVHTGAGISSASGIPGTKMFIEQLSCEDDVDH